MRQNTILLLIALIISVILFLSRSNISSAQVRKQGNPEQNLPPNIVQLTGFGERAAWSPDGKRVAFMAKSFKDAFEIDLNTKLTRLLTGHFPHEGFLRIQYLPNGDFFLIGARKFTDINITRSRDQEMWIMKPDARTPPVSLNQKIFEGVAISRRRPLIAWSNTHGQYPEQVAEDESVMYTAEIEYRDGVPVIINKKEIIRARRPGCTLEPQDFRHDDTELIYTCYRQSGSKADVFGIDLKTKKITTYRKIVDEYNEVEGISPNGDWTAIESSREQGGPERQNSHYIDIWKLELESNSTNFVRLTRWGDYDGYKASNPVVSPDGNWMAFQSGRSVDPAGVGYGIFLMKLR